MRLYNESVHDLGAIRALARRVRAVYRFGVLPPPATTAREAYRSMVYSPYDDVRPSPRLISLAVEAVDYAQRVELDDLAARESGMQMANLWPGDHYRLLVGLVKSLDARRVVEIGTGTGLSALAMLSAMGDDGRVVTFDIVPWQEYFGGVLRDEDFADGRLEQYVADLSVSDTAKQYSELLADADLLFVDAAKDGVQERRFLQLFDSVSFNRAPVVMLDDIRLWTMLEIWRGISRPKLDLTSFGHWSGTGLIDYS